MIVLRELFYRHFNNPNYYTQSIFKNIDMSEAVQIYNILTSLDINGDLLEYTQDFFIEKEISESNAKNLSEACIFIYNDLNNAINLINTPLNSLSSSYKVNKEELIRVGDNLFEKPKFSTATIGQAVESIDKEYTGYIQDINQNSLKVNIDTKVRAIRIINNSYNYKLYEKRTFIPTKFNIIATLRVEVKKSSKINTLKWDLLKAIMLEEGAQNQWVPIASGTDNGHSGLCLLEYDKHIWDVGIYYIRIYSMYNGQILHTTNYTWIVSYPSIMLYSNTLKIGK